MYKPTKLDLWIIEYYRGILAIGLVMIAAAIWMYEYLFSNTGDGLMGIICSGLLFFGTVLIGQGIRGWRDGDEYRNRFIKVRGRTFEHEVTITKKRKKYF
jgi:hypothetical protein